jgi:hypothetical protein
MGLITDGGADREPVMHEVWNIWAFARGSVRPPRVSLVKPGPDQLRVDSGRHEDPRRSKYLLIDYGK